MTLRSTNIWKVAFFVVVLMIVVTMVSLFVLISSSTTNSERNGPLHFELAEGESVFTVTTTKAQVNKLIERYLAEQHEYEMVKYSARLINESFILKTVLPIYGKEIEAKLTFVPAIAENGDLLLYLRSFTFGQLQLPQVRMLELINQQLELPDWIDIFPSQKLLHVKVAMTQLNEQLSVRIVDFNLTDDQIVLEGYVTE